MASDCVSPVASLREIERALRAPSNNMFIEEVTEEIENDSDLDEKELDQLQMEGKSANTLKQTVWGMKAFFGAGGFLLDEDGVIRDDIDVYKNTGHWTDSGFSGDKQASTSTLLQIHTSFDDDSNVFDVDHSVNISELEASKDDLSFEHDTETVLDYATNVSTNVDLVNKRISLEKPEELISHDESDTKSSIDKNEVFSPEYYTQLRELGVLLDGTELSSTKNTFQDCDQEESHQSREKIFDESDHTDSIANYLRKEHERLLEEQQGNGTATENRLRPTSSNSQQTISSLSFPEVSPEEALMLYDIRRRNSSLENSTSCGYEGTRRSHDALEVFNEDGDTELFHRSGNDDEIFLITSLMARHYDGVEQSENITPIPHYPYGSSPSSNGSLNRNRSQTPEENNWIKKSISLTDVSQLNFQNLCPDLVVKKDHKQVYRIFDPQSDQLRSSSLSSRKSTVSLTASQNKTDSDLKNLSKSRSEENISGIKTASCSNEKMPKRLLPNPAVTDNAHSFKMKSRSTSNIAVKSRPVKSTYLSMSDLSRIDHGAEDHDRPQGELTVKLKQEHQKRKQATELVQQLQKDYDSLLSKYALAELTIDQMRLGAKISLHADSPTPKQIQTGSLSMPQHPQVIQMGTAGRGILPTSNSPAPSRIAGCFSPQPGGGRLLQDGTAVLYDLRSL